MPKAIFYLLKGDDRYNSRDYEGILRVHVWDCKGIAINSCV